MTNRKIEYWVIADSEFVAHMESVLDTYAQPYDLNCPVICMNEQPVQLQREGRPSQPVTPQHGQCLDYEYEHAGTANVFMFVEPLVGWREVNVRPNRTKVDWVVEMTQWLEGRYADCERVILVCDNLNTHTLGTFYEAFEPERARQLMRRLEFCCTPKHGSWLNMAENELNSLTRKCLGRRRFGDIETLQAETTAWSRAVNNAQKGVDWQMKVDDAQCKLTSVYPKIKL